MRPFDIADIDHKPQYKRNGAPAYLDPIREILVRATREEEVRQKFLRYMIDQMGVPKEMIDVEVPMCHFQKGARGRADIVGYWRNGKKEDVPLFIVECKPPTVRILEDHIDQVFRYDEIVCSEGNLIVTNGKEVVHYVLQGDKFLPAVKPLTYKAMLNRSNVTVYPENFGRMKRIPFSRFSDPSLVTWMQENNYIGEDCQVRNVPFYANLYGLLVTERSRPRLPIEGRNFRIIDEGVRYTSFSNASGGTAAGDYHYFIIEDSKGENQIISMSVLGTWRCVNDPLYGNRKGHTCLFVAVDDFQNRHQSVQINMDNAAFLIRAGNDVRICHDGRITVGRRGAAKKQDLISFVKERAPYLLEHYTPPSRAVKARTFGTWKRIMMRESLRSRLTERVFLGSLPVDRLIQWDDFTEFLCRTIDYALVRDEFRKMKKAELPAKS